MSTGSTAIEAMVSDAPTRETAPKVIPAAASAIASGSSRRRRRKTISSTTAITSSAAIRSTPTDAVIVAARSFRTTGAPVTM